jgi:hypothetical protein
VVLPNVYKTPEISAKMSLDFIIPRGSLNLRSMDD